MKNQKEIAEVLDRAAVIIACNVEQETTDYYFGRGCSELAANTIKDYEASRDKNN